MENVWGITWKRNGVIWKMYGGNVENVWGVCGNIFGSHGEYGDHMEKVWGVIWKRYGG